VKKKKKQSKLEYFVESLRTKTQSLSEKKNVRLFPTETKKDKIVLA
jgi:hypothetical protein